MWVITHTLTGMAIGAVLGERGAPAWAVVAAALLLHVLLDMVPHWDYVSTGKRAVWALADVAAAVAVLLWAATLGDASWAVLLAGAVSALPDLDVLSALWPGDRRIRLFPSHWSGFPHGWAAPVPGTAAQGVIAGLSVLVISLTGL
jgi:hypothetical protein